MFREFSVLDDKSFVRMLPSFAGSFQGFRGNDVLGFVGMKTSGLS